MTESECQSMTWRDINICGAEAVHCSIDCSTVAPSCTRYCRLGRCTLQFLSQKSWMNLFLIFCSVSILFFLSSHNKASILVLSALQQRPALRSWYNCSAAEVAWSEGPGHHTAARGETREQVSQLFVNWTMNTIINNIQDIAEGDDWRWYLPWMGVAHSR